MSDDAAVYADNGEYLGEMVPIEGGGHALIGADGTVLAAVDEQLRDLDPNQFEMPAGEPDAYDELAAEVADLRDRLDTRPEPIVVEQPAGPDFEALAGHALEQVERAQGRPLSAAQADRFLSDFYADLSSGFNGNVAKSAAVAGIGDLSGHEDRVAYAVERLQDAEREQAGRDFYDPPEPSRESYDMANRDERVAYAQDLIAGADVQGLKYTSDQYDAEGFE